MFEDKRRALEVTWYGCVVLSVCYIIAALVSAARLGKAGEIATARVSVIIIIMK